MKKGSFESGQALILIVVGIAALVGLTGVAIDGGDALADRRHAQNAADSAALSAALAQIRGQDVNTTAMSNVNTNGYDDNGSDNTVTITIVNSPSGSCENNANGKDITVTITSIVKTMFAPVVGIQQLSNTVAATTRACGSYLAPPFDGNAIVTLAPNGTGFDATGTPDWIIDGGGIFANSSSSSAAHCQGNAGVTSPSVTVVGDTSFSCHTVNIDSTTTGAAQYTYSDYSNILPRIPACNGTATFSDGQWHTQAGADGSQVAFSGDMDFDAGLYCITNSPGPFHGQITGAGVTFYLIQSNFSMKFNGGGSLTASAPTGPGEYNNILMFSAPQLSGQTLLNTQTIDMRGNGTEDVVGTIILPSADVTMFGNSGTAGFHTQVIAYKVDSGGNADISISYQQNENHKAQYPASVMLLR